MPLDQADLLARRRRDVAVTWSDADVLLYALAVGLGRDPLATRQLPFVYEGAGLQVVPSFASVLAHTDLLDDCGWNYAQVLHVGERLLVYRPLSDTGRVTLDSRVSGVRDLGAGRGAIVEVETRGYEQWGETAASREPVFSVQRTFLARADGGFEGPSSSGISPHALPPRPADMEHSAPTRPEQALLYRLCGDRNPLHADPVFARQHGLPEPILHGLCTWGYSCCSILHTICDYDPTLIRSMQARFTQPVLPGDTLRTEMWQDANIVSFRVLAQEREITVLDNGLCELVT